jgi:hypothetical protein
MTRWRIEKVNPTRVLNPIINIIILSLNFKNNSFLSVNYELICLCITLVSIPA